MGPRKSFKADLADLNPAMQFISTPEEKPDAPPPGYKYNPLYVETKSRRLQLLIQPSLFDKVRERAQQAGVSVNELIHTIIEEAMGKE